MRRARTSVALLLALCLACSSSARRAAPSSSPPAGSGDDVVRYRLRLRHNPVDPGEAFRCYGHCQEQTTPKGYFECLSQCPGFEITPGAYCAKDEVPPLAACLMVRRVPRSKEVPPGLVVLAVLGSFLLVVGAASLCSSSSSQCGTIQAPQ
ncbi:MAG TPA: hypothetical protein VGP93_04725 [Polyangiaceae bacterium]|nr:hypothetical protein [Polyangiaceae bacterium]